MASYRARRFLPLIIVLALVVAAVVIFIAGSGLFDSSLRSDGSRSALISTVAERSVRMTVRGPLVADENYFSYVMDISPNSRDLSIHKGYEDEAVGEISLGNSVRGYEQLVYALDRAGMMNGVVVKGDANETRGICAKGYLYKFEIMKNDKSEKMLWTTSCGGGSFRANRLYVKSLFIKQIPEAQIKIDELIGRL